MTAERGLQPDTGGAAPGTRSVVFVFPPSKRRLYALFGVWLFAIATIVLAVSNRESAVARWLVVVAWTMTWPLVLPTRWLRFVVNQDGRGELSPVWPWRRVVSCEVGAPVRLVWERRRTRHLEFLGGADGQPICTDLSAVLPADGWDTMARRPRLARVVRRVGLTGSPIVFLSDLAAKGLISKVLCDFSRLSPPQVEHLERLLQINAVPYSLDGPSAATLSG